MAQTSLVDSEKEDGRILVNHLVQNGIKVTAACWIRRDEESRPVLFIATPLVDQNGGTKEAYLRIHKLMQQIPQPFWIGPLELSLVDPGNSVAKAVMELQRRFPGNRPIHRGDSQFGGMMIAEAYVYPPVSTRGILNA